MCPCHAGRSTDPRRENRQRDDQPVVQETVDSATSSDSSLDIPASPVQLPHIPPVSIAAIAAPVVADMQQMNANLRSIAGDRDPALQAAADQIFGAGGKQLRPMIVFLVARATAALAGLRCGLQHQAPACARITCLDPAISSCPCVRSCPNHRPLLLQSVSMCSSSVLAVLQSIAYCSPCESMPDMLYDRASLLTQLLFASTQ